MKISIIVAVGAGNVIGYKNKLPWHLPADLAHFQKTTKGHHVIMGQITFESIGKALPNRTNIVLSFDRNYHAAGCTVASSLERAIEIAKNAGEKETFIIGGASVYKQALPITNKIYLTKVDGEFEADTYFPKIDNDHWKATSYESHKKDSKNKYNYSFVTLEAC